MKKEMLNKISPYYHHTDETINGILGINIAILLIILFLGFFRPYAHNTDMYRLAVWILLFCGILGPTVMSFIALIEVKQLKEEIKAKADKAIQA